MPDIVTVNFFIICAEYKSVRSLFFSFPRGSLKSHSAPLNFSREKGGLGGYSYLSYPFGLSVRFAPPKPHKKKDYNNDQRR